MRQKYTNAKILGKITETPQTTREITEKLSYVDKKGKTWKPALITIYAKLKLLCEARLIIREGSGPSTKWVINNDMWK